MESVTDWINQRQYEDDMRRLFKDFPWELESRGITPWSEDDTDDV